jgi:hypothetical protein
MSYRENNFVAAIALAHAAETIKVFRMNACDWYAAATADDAIRAMAGWNGYPETPEGIALLCRDHEVQPVELTDEEMNLTQFALIDGDEQYIGRISFRERLDEMLLDGEEFPTFFASTEY